MKPTLNELVVRGVMRDGKRGWQIYRRTLLGEWPLGFPLHRTFTTWTAALTIANLEAGKKTI